MQRGANDSAGIKSAARYVTVGHGAAGPSPSLGESVQGGASDDAARRV